MSTDNLALWNLLAAQSHSSKSFCAEVLGSFFGPLIFYVYGGQLFGTYPKCCFVEMDGDIRNTNVKTARPHVEYHSPENLDFALPVEKLP